jgi:hypothetical protein
MSKTAPPASFPSGFDTLLDQARYAEALGMLREPLSAGVPGPRDEALKRLRRVFYAHRCYTEIIGLVEDCLAGRAGDADLLELALDSHAHLGEISKARDLFTQLSGVVETARQISRAVMLVPKIHAGEARFAAHRELLARLDQIAPVPERSAHALIAHASLRLALADLKAFHDLIDRTSGMASGDDRLVRLRKMADRARIFEAMQGQVPKIFCIGLSKTGTTSLHKALEQMGFMSAHWTNPITGQLLGDDDIPYFDALSDTPISYRFEELYYTFPRALFIYTVRPQSSWERSIFKHFSAMQRDAAGQTFATLKARNLIVRDGLFGYERHKIHASLYFNHASLAEAHQVFDQRVRRFFADKPAARFLAFDIIGGQGWPELCRFLGAPVPKSAFPWRYRSPSASAPGGPPQSSQADSPA